MLSLSPDLNAQFTAFADDALGSGPLADRDLAVVMLAAALVLEDGEMVKHAIVAAKQAGVSNEEIGQVSAALIVLRGQRIAGLGLGTSTPSRATAPTACCR